MKYQGRLPLHLLYRFQESGTYQVRFLQRTLPLEMSGEAKVLLQSEWTVIRVLPSRPGQRAAWLRSVREHLPSDAGEMLSDTLPSVLGVPDEASFAIVSGYLEHGVAFWPEKDNGKRTRQR